MDFSLDIDLQYLDGFSVCYFKDVQHSEDSPPHYYVTIPAKNDSCLIICMSTSQEENITNYYTKANKECLNSLITLDVGDMEWVKKRSIIDCNGAEWIHKNSLKRRICLGSYHHISETVPENIKKDIIAAIIKSPKVKPFIKRNMNI